MSGWKRLVATCACSVILTCGCSDGPGGSPTEAQSHAVEAGICDSTVHETSSLAATYSFDLECAVDYLREAGCDFTLDPDGDGERFASSTIEDMHNDPADCSRGLTCSGCDDSDSLDSVADCAEFARFSHFTESEWRDLQAECSAEAPAADGCAIEGVTFSGVEMDCALQFFTTMTCEECVEVFDSRVCEDAINDSGSCKFGAICTGCDDGDARDNGVTCAEIEAYSYLGPAAAQGLLDLVQAYPCEQDCDPVCDGRTCGDDGCGGVCGTCADGETCDVQGLCEQDGCTIEGIYFGGWQMDCALTFFETTTCDDCDAVLDSRTCEDAFNDPTACQVGGTCSGCDDGDTRADGVSCEEIAAYSYFGASSAQALFDYVAADPSCGEPDLVVEGVPLTEDEASAILAVANGASQTQLDDGAGLDARAAENIVEGRPLATIYELADISYVGPTAVGQLRDYAVGWAGPDDPPEDPVAECGTISVATLANADATDFARLMELATMGDYPAYVLESFQATGCPSFMDDAATQDEMMWALWAETYWWDRDDVPASMLDNGSWTAGGSSYQGALARALLVLSEYVDYGDWDPNSSPEGASLYARRQELVDALSAGAVASPTGFVEIHMGIEASECSEEAVALIDLSDMSVVVVHQMPRC